MSRLPEGSSSVSREPSSLVVKGLAREAVEQRVELFFHHFPWTPSLHVRLAQWETRSFFDRFLP